MAVRNDVAAVASRWYWPLSARALRSASDWDAPAGSSENVVSFFPVEICCCVAFRLLRLPETFRLSMSYLRLSVMRMTFAPRDQSRN